MLEVPARIGIDSAVPSDAREIYEIKRASFGEDYLIFTPYQTPQSVNYIRELIEKQTDDVVRVWRSESSIEGYSMSRPLGDRLHLNYIATSSARRRDGLGTQLMHDIEEQASAKGCRRLTLDVFESNHSAFDWYIRQGYRVVKECLNCVVDLRSAVPGQPLSILQSDYESALDDISNRGFGAVSAKLRTANIRLGLIGSDLMRLLEYSGVQLPDVVAASKARFCNERSFLIVSGQELNLTGLTLARSEVAVTMEKTLL